ncbi:MAG: fibronectin type III domain-containing protein [Candidatus Aenigmatarchaeota archaeon]
MNSKMVAVFSVFLLAGVLAFFAASANSEVCEVCSDVENTFTIDEVALGATNTITLKGYESHGLKSLSISCELICGRPNDYCCFDVSKNKWKCAYDYLYCNQPNENGKCVEDKIPPSVGVVGVPSSSVSPPGGSCVSFSSSDVTAKVACTDAETGCDNSNLLLEIDEVKKASCPQNENNYFSVSTSGYLANRPYYICAAAKDLAGNINYTKTPVQFCTSTGEPIRPWLYAESVGGSIINLVWSQAGLNSPNFDRYELHYENNPAKDNFDVSPLNLKATITEEKLDNFYQVTGLVKNTRYCFRVVVFDKTSPKARNTTSDSLCLSTVECNPGEKTQCFTRDWTTYYGEEVYLPPGCPCTAGEATCDGGYWSACMNQVGPFEEKCDGIDNDCDGMTDMEIDYSTYTWDYDYVPLQKLCIGLGECGYGYVQCLNGQWQGDAKCSSYSLAKTEVCDGLDNDCNGVVDDVGGGNSIISTRCGCYNINHDPSVMPSSEVCNGIDDDCDGTIDNVFGGYSAASSRCACYNGAKAPGQQQETCNKIDDDCNGAVDDGMTGGEGWLTKLGMAWPDWSEYCGTGTPCDGGHWECNAGGTGVLCSTIGGGENKATNETCNGIDDDCDLEADEGCACSPPGSWGTCGINVGECTLGQRQCSSGGVWGTCIGSKNPTTEICDGKDNNCNNKTDDVYGGNSVNSTQCRCYNAGTPSQESCNGIDDDCNGVVDDVGGGKTIASTRCGCYFNGSSTKVLPGQNKEICDNIDNDCNGVVDDPWSGSLGKDCGYGACAGGKIVCKTTGNDTVCSTNSPYGIGNSTDKRSVETCNSLDDDCNGVIDDVNGKQTTAESQCGCYGGAAKKDEFCNKIDDNCNGAIDENLLCACFAGQKKACGSAIGECELGEAECSGGIWGTCTGGKKPAKETCNMKDDDCDGIIDNVNSGYSVEETQCGCYNGRKPTVEKCDGIDNDCNVKTDDNIDCSCNEGDEMQCGSNVGECTPGLKKCVNGRWGECSGGVLPKKEACNGIDDDCNGVIDDVDGGNSVGSSKCACYNKFSVPNTQEEVANGIDDDCDGSVDEGYSNEPSHCQNGFKDGDEQGVDCGGSCRKMCAQPIPMNTWILIFAVIAGVIAVFGIFISSFWKKETKSLFERVK